VVVHARKAWLEGLSPKENRTIPPLDYALVHALKAAHPGLPIAINGGFEDLAAARAQLAFVDGVMIGRAAYHNPELLLGVDPQIFGAPAPFPDAFAALDAYAPYVERELARGTRLHDMTRHLLGLFAGRPGARLYRQKLATQATRPGAGLAVLREAVGAVAREALAEAV
jgi:tRNA-dihydrouridine synthase A